MPTYVPGTGNPNAKLIVLGEAPGAEEDGEGIPFIGPAGGMLDSIAKQAGWFRNEVWLTNVVKFRPPENDFGRINEIGVNLEEVIEELRKEVKTIGATTILALGNEALKATTGLSGITKWRGSILRSKWSSVKVVPSFHPAALLYQHGNQPGLSYFWKSVMALDFKRAWDESFDEEYNIPDRNLIVCQNAKQLFDYLRKYEEKEYCAIDIETRKCIPVCLALAFSRHESMSIPLLEPNSWHDSKSTINDAEMNEIWRLLIGFFQRPGLKIIGQNFKFDHEKLLVPCGFPVPDPYADTMLQMHTVNPELPKSLDFIASIYTREPYYKDEGREFDLRKHPIERFFLYNAKDSAVTFEAWEELDKELDELNLRDFFYGFVMKLHPLYMHIESNGFKIDEARRKELVIQYTAKLKEIQKEFLGLTGYIPVTAEELKALQKVAKKTESSLPDIINLGSTQQLGELLYEVMGFPKRSSTDEDTLVALLGNHCSKDDRKKRVLELIMDHRKVLKTLNGPLKAKTDYDGRMRTSYKICGTETGRTSTVMPDCPVRPEPMGAAFQLLTKHGDIGPEVREMYIPGY